MIKMRNYKQMEADIQRRIHKIISDKAIYAKIDDRPKCTPSVYGLDIELDYYAWPGGYPIFYVTRDNEILCPKCTNENIELLSDPYDLQWYVVGCDINYEDSNLYCDHCGERIESAYGDCDE